MVLQVTGRVYTAGYIPPGISANHMLGTGSEYFWAHNTVTVGSDGDITISEWVDSFGGSAPGGTRTGSISASGTLTIAEVPTYHGQASDDGKFSVATQTVTTGVYSLGVTTKGYAPAP
jgi:hypothetical protein